MIKNSIMKVHKLAHYPQALSCPYCDSTDFIRRGKAKTIQRYKCKKCFHSFKDTTATPLHQLHKKDKVPKYIEALHLGLSVRKAAKYAGISKNTAFAWRHKFLSSLSKAPEAIEPEAGGGARIIRLPYSAKGRKKTPEKQQQATKTLLIKTKNNLTIKVITHKNSTTKTAKVINNILSGGYIATSPDKLLSKAINKELSTSIIKNTFIKHKYIELAKKAESKALSWMKRFRGVASKYLNNYWYWHIALRTSQERHNGITKFAETCTSFRSLNQYRLLKEQ